MTKRDETVSSGGFFVRYLIGGLVLLVVVIGIARVLIVDQGVQRLFLSGAILCVNLLTVGLYTFAILGSKRLRADSEAPDMAYYLGFSMTVGALSFSFLSDVVASQSGSAQVNSNLVGNALGQFGAGLLATLFGLCAKIYLSSQQAQEFSDPDSLYQQFRSEISDFRQSLSETTNELVSSVKASCEAMSSAASGTSSAMSKLADELAEVQRRVSTELSAERVTASVKSFADGLNQMGVPAVTLSNNMESLSAELAQAKIGISELSAQTRQATEDLTAQLKAGAAQEASISKLTDSSLRLIEVQSALNMSVQDSSAQLTKLTMIIPEVSELISQLGFKAQPASEQLSRLTNATAPAVLQIGAFNDSLTDTKDSFNLVRSANINLADSGVKAQASLVELVSSVDGADKSIKQLSLSFHEDQIISQQFGEKLERLNKILEQVNVGASDLLGQLELSASAIGSLGSSAQTAVASISTAPQAIERFSSPLELASQSVNRLNEALGQLKDRANQVDLDSTQSFRRG